MTPRWRWALALAFLGGFAGRWACELALAAGPGEAARLEPARSGPPTSGRAGPVDATPTVVPARPAPPGSIPVPGPVPPSSETSPARSPAPPDDAFAGYGYSGGRAEWMWEHFYGVRGLVEPFLRRFGHVRVRPLGLRPHEVDAAIATRRSVWPAHEPAFDMRARHARLNARMPRTIRPGRFAVIAFDSGGRLDAWTGHHSGRGRSALGSGREDLQRLAASKGALHDDASVAARERAADGILLEWAVREEQLRRELWRDCVALLREPGAEVRYRQPVAAAFVDIWRGLVLIPRGTAPAVDNALLALEEARQGLRRRLARILSQ